MCGAWQTFHDDMRGKSWPHCATLRNDPCACVAANCDDFSGNGCGIIVTCTGDSGGTVITAISLNYYVPSRVEFTAGSTVAGGRGVHTTDISVSNYNYNLPYCNPAKKHLCNTALESATYTDNKLSYTPPTLTLKSLVEVHAGNGLVGTLSASFGALTDLKLLNIGGNPGICGSLPATLAKLTALEVLNVTGNALTGPAPTHNNANIWKTCSLGGGNNTYCAPLPDGAAWCHAHGRVQTSGNCAPTPAPHTPAPTPPPTPPPTYKCMSTPAGNACQIAKGGLSKEDCATFCVGQLYQCTGCKCVKSATGIAQADCAANCNNKTSVVASV